MVENVFGLNHPNLVIRVCPKGIPIFNGGESCTKAGLTKHTCCRLLAWHDQHFNLLTPAQNVVKPVTGQAQMLRSFKQLTVAERISKGSMFPSVETLKLNLNL